ncbi:unnamed protein product, partial [Adineta ricciae]
SNSVSILRNVGNGTFVNQIVCTVGSGPWTVEVAYVNNDSQLDIVVVNKGDNNVGVLLHA